MKTQFHREVLHKRSPSPSHRNANGYLKIKQPSKPLEVSPASKSNASDQIKSDKITSNFKTTVTAETAAGTASPSVPHEQCTET